MVDCTKKQDADTLEKLVALACHDGGSTVYTDILLVLLDENWVINKEDILELIGEGRDCRAATKVYEMIDRDIPYSFGSHRDKCVHALSLMNCEVANIYLKILEGHSDPRVNYNARIINSRRKRS
jgi:hypothetical protein